MVGPYKLCNVLQCYLYESAKKWNNSLSMCTVIELTVETTINRYCFWLQVHEADSKTMPNDLGKSTVGSVLTTSRQLISNYAVQQNVEIKVHHRHGSRLVVRFKDLLLTLSTLTINFYKNSSLLYKLHPSFRKKIGTKNVAL